MKWLIPVFLRIVIGDILANSLIKKLSHFGSPTARIFWTFLFCALGSFLFAMYQGLPLFTLPNGVVFGMGLLNSVALYCEWLAFQISMSKANIFIPVANLISILLGYLLLGEAQYLNSWLLAGIFLGIIGVTLVLYAGIRCPISPQSPMSFHSRALFFYALTFSIIWGITGFLMRFLSVKVALKPAAFLSSWYAGSLVGTYFFCLFNTSSPISLKINVHAILASALLSSLLAGSLFMNFWSLQLAPLTVVQPIYLVSSMIAPVLVGLFVFGERKVLRRLEVLGITISCVAGVLVAVSFL